MVLQRLLGHPASLAACAEASAELARHFGVVDRLDCSSAEGYKHSAITGGWRKVQSLLFNS